MATCGFASGAADCTSVFCLTLAGMISIPFQYRRSKYMLMPARVMTLGFDHELAFMVHLKEGKTVARLGRWMAIDPNDIQLTADQRQLIADLAEQQGTLHEDVLTNLIASAAGRRRNGMSRTLKSRTNSVSTSASMPCSKTGLPI